MQGKVNLSRYKETYGLSAIRTRLTSLFDKDFIFIVSVVCVLSFATNGFAFSNVMYTHDSLSFGYPGGRVGILLALGKWGCYFYSEFIRLTYAAPFLIGVLSTIYVAFSVALVKKLFQLNRLQSIIVAIIMTVNICLIATFATYIQNGDEYCLALLFACLAVYTHEEGAPILNIIIPIIFTTLCMGMYAAYADCIIVLFILKIIYDIIYEKEKGVVQHFIHGIGDIIILMVGSWMNLFIMKRLAAKIGIELSTGYNGPGNLEKLSLQIISDAVQSTLVFVRDFFFEINAYNTEFFAFLNKVVIVLIIVATVFCVYELRKNVASMLLMCVLICLLPLAASVIFLISNGTMHWLMAYSLTFVYLIPIIMLGKEWDNSAKWLICAKKLIIVISSSICVLMGYHNFSYGNGAYTYKKLVYDNTYANVQKIWEDINCVEGYDINETTVVIMGEFEESKIAYKNEISKRYIDVMPGASYAAVTYAGTLGNFITKVMGKEMILSYNDPKVENNIQYINMPSYPHEGYISVIDKQVVVKISE